MLEKARSMRAAIAKLTSSGFGKRLAYGTALNSSGQAIIILSQLLIPPLLIATWGFETYGVWLILMTVPASIAMLDLGFGLAASNAVLQRTAKGEKVEAQSAFSALLYFSIFMSGFLTIVFWFSMPALIQGFAAIMDVDSAKIAPIMPFVIATSLLGIVASSLFNACRAVGGYLWGTAVNVVFLAVDPIIVVVTSLMGAGLLGAAAALSMSGLLKLATFIYVLHKFNPDFSYSPTHVRGAEIRRLLPLALSAFALPASTAVSLHATVIIVTQSFGLIAGASFALVRTLSRVIFQAVSVVVRSCLVDYTHAVSEGNEMVVRQIESVVRSAVLLVVLPGVTLFVLLGPFFVEIWAHGEIEFPVIGYGLLGIGISAHVIWNVELMLLIALNNHKRKAMLLVFTQIIAILSVATVAEKASFEATLFILALVELGICVFMLWGRSLKKWPTNQ